MVYVLDVSIRYHRPAVFTTLFLPKPKHRMPLRPPNPVHPAHVPCAHQPVEHEVQLVHAVELELDLGVVRHEQVAHGLVAVLPIGGQLRAQLHVHGEQPRGEGFHVAVGRVDLGVRELEELDRLALVLAQAVQRGAGVDEGVLERELRGDVEGGLPFVAFVAVPSLDAPGVVVGGNIRFCILRRCTGDFNLFSANQSWGTASNRIWAGSL